MREFRKLFEEIVKDKKKYRIFIASGISLFILLLIIFISMNNSNNGYSVETSEIANGKYEQTEIDNSDDTLVVEIEKMPAQELTEEEQKEIEEEEKEANSEIEENNSSDSVPSGYGTSYYIKVNYGANVVTIYSKDSDGNYNPFKAMVCSSGRATPSSGVYKTKSAKYRWGALFGGVWGQYTTQIVGNILFHSVPYLSADPSDLEYWEYDKLGTTASAGCIRLRVCDAKWIYDNIPTGTPVEFYSDSNPGPLGKPGAKKISDNEACRGWDPTDPNGNNPWNNEIQREQEEERKRQEEQQREEQQKQEEQRRIEEERKQEEVRKMEEQRKQEEQKKLEEQQKQEELKKQEEKNNQEDNSQNQSEKTEQEENKKEEENKQQETNSQENDNENMNLPENEETHKSENKEKNEKRETNTIT